MLPLSPEMPLEGREIMASVPEAINLVKPGRSGAESPAKDTQHGSIAVEDKRELPTTFVSSPREDVQVADGSNQGSITHVALPATSVNEQVNRQGMKRYAFREPIRLQSQPGTEKRVSHGILGSKEQLPQMTATNGRKRGAMENGRWMEISAARPGGTDVKGAATNTSRDVNSDDEYIDVETFDPVEDRRQWLLEQSRRLVASNRAPYQDVTSDPKIPSSAEQHVSRGTTDTAGEHSAIDDDRVPSLDSGFQSDEDVRVRMRRSSSDWTDSVGETYRSKERGPGRLSSSAVTPEDTDKSNSYQEVYLATEDKTAFSPPQPTSNPERPTPHHELREIATFKHKTSSTEPPPMPVTYVKSYGGYTVYIPGNVPSPGKDISVTSNSNVRVPDALSGAVSRNSTEVVYTMNTSTVRMSTSTSSVIDSRALYDNTKPAGSVVQRKSVVVATGNDGSSTQDLNRRDPEDARVSGENLRTKSVARSNVEVLPNGRDEVSHRYLQQFSNYSQDRAVIIPIPSEKSAFVNTSPSSTQNAVVAPSRYLRVEGGVPETRISIDRNASDFERMGPPLDTVRRYIPSGTYLPRAYVTHPHRMVVASPVSSQADADTMVVEGATHANGFNDSNVHRRPDSRMTPNSRESEYVYHHSKPMRVVYTPISDVADDEPPTKMSRLTCGSERLLSIAEIEHESQTAARLARYPASEALIMGAQLRDGDGRSKNPWPLAYGSHILKTYLRGQDELDKESLHRSKSPPPRGEVLHSQIGAERDFRPWFRKRLRADEELSRSDKREGNTTIEIRSIIRGQEGNFRKPLNEYNSNGDVSGTLDLSKKYPAQQRDAVASAKEAIHFTRVQPRYVSSEGSYSSAELHAKSFGDPVMTPASVIVTSGAGGSRHGLQTAGEHLKQVVRTVIVSTDRSKVSNGQKSLPLPTEAGTERFREVRAEGREVGPTTVLVPEPGGQRSRYMITREGDGNRFVIRPVGSDVRSAAGQLVAIKDKIESELSGRSFPQYPVGAVQRLGPKDVSKGDVGAARDSDSPGDDRRQPPASVIRTAPSAPSRDGRLERQRLTEGDLSDDEVVEVYRVRRVLPSGMTHFEPTAAECSWADAEWASSGGKVEEDSVYGPSDSDEDRALRLRMSVILWALLGGERLRAVGWPRQPPRRVLWRTVDVCCSVAGAKSPAAVPLPADHDCGADMACFRDHAHRFLEVCAPTRDHWKRYGWASLTIDAVVAKVYREDIAPWLRTLPDEVVPAAVRGCLRQLQELRGADTPPRATPPPALPPSPHDAAPAPAPATPAAAAAHSPLQRVPLATVGLSPTAGAAASASEETQDARKKRGRPAKPATKADAAGRVERVMLWRFLLNLLEDPRNEPCIHWVNRDQGIFRILNTDWLARLWGRRHGNPRMTYEKMARAMRTYYRSKVLQPVPRSPNLPRKLVYKFNPAVVQRVAAANKLAQQQQQQQQQHQQQRFRQPRHALQYEGDQLRHVGADTRPQSQPQPRSQSQLQPRPQSHPQPQRQQPEDRSPQMLLHDHQQRRQLPQHEHYYLSEKRQLKPQLHLPNDHHKPLDDGQHWEPFHKELQRRQVFHQSNNHRLSPEESHSNQVPVHQRLQQYHQPRLQLYQLHHEPEPLRHEVQNNVPKEAHQQSHHHQQQRQQTHQNTDEHSRRSYSESQHQQDHHRDQRTFEENDHHSPITSPSDYRQRHSPIEHRNHQVMQRVSHSPSNDVHRKTEDSHRQHEDQPELEQAQHRREVLRSSPEGQNQHDHQQQQAPNERDSSTPHFQQT